MDNSAPLLFDFDRLKANRVEAVSRLKQHNFLIYKAAERIVDSLQDIQRDFYNIAIIGSRGAEAVRKTLQVRPKIGGQKWGKFGAFLHRRKIKVTVFDIVDSADQVMTTEIPDLKQGDYDCIIALPYLHTVNDVPGFLQRVKSALKPDGVFLCSLFGGQSLCELRETILKVELEKRDGAGQHIHPMIDHQQFAGLFQSAGFALPVIDYDRIHVRYSELQTLYDDLIGMGEGNALTERPQSISDIKADIEEYYRTNFYDGGFITTFDILHGIGWAPHESQQQPARRGSGEVSMTEVL